MVETEEARERERERERAKERQSEGETWMTGSKREEKEQVKSCLTTFLLSFHCCVLTRNPTD